jgi:hypothetical protein
MKEQEFNEAEYLGANPDVAAAVKEGKFHSGREHYEKYGEREGRILNRLLGRASREEQLVAVFNDVDFCLRVREAGYQNVWSPLR